MSKVLAAERKYREESEESEGELDDPDDEEFVFTDQLSKVPFFQAEKRQRRASVIAEMRGRH